MADLKPSPNYDSSDPKRTFESPLIAFQARLQISF